jgi:uncharacterized protein GlcG (DUF336 family)
MQAITARRLVLLATFSIQGNAGQAALPTKYYLPLELAQKAAMAAMAQCRVDGFSVSVTVLDRAGEPIVFLRNDDSRPHHAEPSRRKAYTALTLGMPSGELPAFITSHPAAAQLVGLPGMSTLGGGLPIRSAGEVVGSIGVAGAPGGEKDVACARSGIDSIAARLTTVDALPEKKHG